MKIYAENAAAKDLRGRPLHLDRQFADVQREK